MTPAFMRFLVIIVLVLYLTNDQCYGFSEDLVVCRRDLCRKLPNTDPCENCNCPAKNGPSMGPTDSVAFSCGDCNPGTMYDPYVCKYCYKGTENEAFSCQSCKIGPKSKPFICDDCEANPAYDASQESATGILLTFILIFHPTTQL